MIKKTAKEQLKKKQNRADKIITSDKKWIRTMKKKETKEIIIKPKLWETKTNWKVEW